MKEHSARLAIRLPPELMAKVEAYAKWRGVPVSCCVRDVLADWIGTDQGRSSEIDRIGKMLRRQPRRLPGASRRRLK